MGWPYEIIDLTAEEKAARRDTLDSYAFLAHYSAYVAPALYLLYRLGAWAFGGSSRKSRSYEPISSGRRHRGASGLAVAWRKAKWWFSEPVSKTGDHGHRDEWILGIAWAIWLLTLCFIDTGNGRLIP